MKDYLVEQQLLNDTQGLFNRFWLIRAVDEKHARRIMCDRLDSRYYTVASVKEYNPILDNVNIVNYKHYASRYLV